MLVLVALLVSVQQLMPLVPVPAVRVVRLVSARLVLLQVTALPVEVTRVILVQTTRVLKTVVRMMLIRARALPTMLIRTKALPMVVPPRVLPSRAEEPAQAKSPAWVRYAGP